MTVGVLTCRFAEEANETLVWTVGEVIERYLKQRWEMEAANRKLKAERFELRLDSKTVAWFMPYGLGSIVQVEPLLKDIVRRAGVCQVEVQLGVTYKYCISGVGEPVRSYALEPASVTFLSRAVSVDKAYWILTSSTDKIKRVFLAAAGTKDIQEIKVTELPEMRYSRSDSKTLSLGASMAGMAVSAEASISHAVSVRLTGNSFAIRAPLSKADLIVVQVVEGVLGEKHEIMVGFRFHKRRWPFGWKWSDRNAWASA